MKSWISNRNIFLRSFIVYKSNGIQLDSSCIIQLNCLGRYLLDFKTQTLICQNYPIEFRYKFLLNKEKIFILVFYRNSFSIISSNSTSDTALKFNRVELEDSDQNCTWNMISISNRTLLEYYVWIWIELSNIWHEFMLNYIVKICFPYWIWLKSNLKFYNNFGNM